MTAEAVTADRHARQARAASYSRWAGAEPVRPSLASLSPEQSRLVRALIAAARAERTAEPQAN
jgi:hypothetical protein